MVLLEDENMVDLIDLKVMDEIIQEFSRKLNSDWNLTQKDTKISDWPIDKIKAKSELINLAMMESHHRRSKIVSLNKKDIPCLHEEWLMSSEDIMNGALEWLPPLREVNHRIPLIDEGKRYKYGVQAHSSPNSWRK